MYEAKFSKFKANKAQRDFQPEKKTETTKPTRHEIEPESQDPDCVFSRLKVSERDKMHYYLLKWIFNAIKKTSTPTEHRELKGQEYIEKKEFLL